MGLGASFHFPLPLSWKLVSIFHPNKQSSVNLVQKTPTETINQSVIYELLRAD